jgi:hypothetical protein
MNLTPDGQTRVAILQSEGYTMTMDILVRI